MKVPMGKAVSPATSPQARPGARAWSLTMARSHRVSQILDPHRLNGRLQHRTGIGKTGSLARFMNSAELAPPRPGNTMLGR